MTRDRSLARIILALLLAAAAFLAAAAILFYEVADVKHLGWRLGGPSALAGETAGLFGGGLAAFLVLIAVLRARRSGRG